MPHGSSGAAAGLRVCVCVCVCVFFNVRIPANVAQIKFKLEVNRIGGGFHLFTPRRVTSRNLESTWSCLPPTPPLLTTRNKATGVGVLTEDAASAF